MIINFRTSTRDSYVQMFHLPENVAWRLFIEENGEADRATLILSYEGNKIALVSSEVIQKDYPNLPGKAVSLLFEEIISEAMAAIAVTPSPTVLDLETIYAEVADKWEPVWEDMTKAIDNEFYMPREQLEQSHYKLAEALFDNWYATWHKQNEEDEDLLFHTEEPVIPTLSFGESHGEIDIWLEDGNNINLLIGSISLKNDHASIAAAVSGFEAVSMVLLDRTVGCKNNVIRSYDYEPLVKQVERFMAVRNIMKD